MRMRKRERERGTMKRETTWKIERWVPETQVIVAAEARVKNRNISAANRL